MKLRPTWKELRTIRRRAICSGRVCPQHSNAFASILKSESRQPSYPPADNQQRPMQLREKMIQFFRIIEPHSHGQNQHRSWHDFAYKVAQYKLVVNRVKKMIG